MDPIRLKALELVAQIYCCSQGSGDGSGSGELNVEYLEQLIRDLLQVADKLLSGELD
jgi:hypothetical protein